jgi:hypothetical protein
MVGFALPASAARKMTTSLCSRLLQEGAGIVTDHRADDLWLEVSPLNQIGDSSQFFGTLARAVPALSGSAGFAQLVVQFNISAFVRSEIEKAKASTAC